ncbi:MAG: hypothetical protein KAS32_30265 [Candidatus Peribacteraceae bacterium]|nr:hypothetical protein [Candidatus Peribacteraceae bacterium]
MKFGVYDTKDNCWLGDAGPENDESFTGAHGPVKAFDDDVISKKFPDKGVEGDYN